MVGEFTPVSSLATAPGIYDIKCIDASFVKDRSSVLVHVDAYNAPRICCHGSHHAQDCVPDDGDTES